MSPRSTIQNEKIREESTSRILDAAFRLMAQHGYESTSISQIAKEAGVSKGLMYNYFDSKEDLLKSLINKVIGDSESLVGGLLEDNPSQTLANIIRWFFDELRNNIGDWKFITDLMLKADKFDFIKELVVTKLSEYTTLLSSLLKQIGYENAKEEAQLIGALFDGIGFQYLVIGKEYPLDEMEKYLIDKYCKQ